MSAETFFYVKILFVVTFVVCMTSLLYRRFVWRPDREQYQARARELGEATVIQTFQIDPEVCPTCGVRLAERAVACGRRRSDA